MQERLKQDSAAAFSHGDQKEGMYHGTDSYRRGNAPV